MKSIVVKGALVKIRKIKKVKINQAKVKEMVANTIISMAVKRKMKSIVVQM